MPHRRHTAWSQLGAEFANDPKHLFAAFLFVLAAAILTFGSTFLLEGRAPLAFFVLAVVLSSARGMSTGLLATVLSLGVMFLMFRENISMPLATKSGLALFAGIGIATNLIFYKLERANTALREAKEEVDAANRLLLQHAESLARVNSDLAERTVDLFQAHERLRQFANLSARRMQAPLKTISLSANVLLRSTGDGLDASSQQASESIRSEIHRMETMVADLRDRASDEPAISRPAQGSKASN
jgi:signal transduction histidine kinase